MITTLADPWLAQNAGRRYPLADDAETTIPDSAILDFRCTVRGVSDGDTPRARITRVYYITMSGAPAKRIEVEVSSGGAVLATLRFDVLKSLAENSHHVIHASSGPAYGTMTVTGHVANLMNENHDVAFAATTVVVDTLGVDSVQGIPGVSYATEGKHHIDNPLAILTGDIALDTGANTDPYLDGNRLRLEIAKGYGRGEWCQRQEATQNCGNVLFTINGERPGSDGDIRLVGEGGVLIHPKKDEHAIEISIDRPASDLMTKDCTAAC